MKIVIADPSWIVAMGLVRAIEPLTEAAEFFLAANAGSLDRLIADHADADFVFVDDTILADEEEAVFARLRKWAPRVAIGVLVGETDRERVLKAIYFGAAAIIPKQADEETVVGTLRALFSGQAAVPLDLLKSSSHGDGPEPGSWSAHSEPRPEPDTLTRREREVMLHIGAGKTVARIAADLQLSPHTVRVHVTRIMKKLDIRDRSSLIHYAVRQNDDRGVPRRLS